MFGLILKPVMRCLFQRWNTIPISSPWQLLAEQVGLVLRVIPINQDGELIYSEFEKLLNEKTKLLAITQLSNRSPQYYSA